MIWFISLRKAIFILFLMDGILILIVLVIDLVVGVPLHFVCVLMIVVPLGCLCRLVELPRIVMRYFLRRGCLF